MDLKVSIEGVLREVCGVVESTTCEEIIFKLAQAASLPGFYTLVAKYRGREETLSPDERIINFFRSINENPSNVQFILRRLEAPSPHPSHSKPHAKDQAPNVNYRPKPSTYSGSKEFKSAPFTPSSNNWPPTKSRQNPSLEQASHRTFEITHPIGAEPLRPDPSRNAQESDEYRQLEDQLARQEQQVELNRIRLLHLDKEIAQLERSQRLANPGDGGFAVGPAAELAQLAATPWPKLLEANRARQRELLRERERYQLAVERVTGQLVQAQNEVVQLEAQVAKELNQLIPELEAANAHRRQILRSLSPTAVHVRPAVNSTDGVPI
ncbi:unnamed protein product [Calicophoron daubneyi]|uniref:Ras-associating domain-containing protein n=1 Tax=Calicophoron daubneyi TaxID=300641 RepID=A0AAV2TLX8_CALDB